MKIILLTGIIFTVVQTMFTSKHEKPNNSKPCDPKIVQKTDNNFTIKHFIPKNESLNSEEDWKSYLNRTGLWCRTRKQSFIPANMTKDVLQICSRSGLHVKGNLCSSRKTMLVFEVLSFKCPPEKELINSYIKVTWKQQFVIVACNMVRDKCLPVHFEGNKTLKRTKEPCTAPLRLPTNQSKGFIISGISKNGY